MNYSFEKPLYNLNVEINENGAIFAGGCFGGLSLAPSPVFSIVLESILGLPNLEITSENGWERVRCRQYGNIIRMHFARPVATCGQDITVAVIGTADENGISWNVDVINDSEDWSVAEVTYPTPEVEGSFDLLTPAYGGRLLKEADSNPIDKKLSYPRHAASMQFFAFCGKQGGLYLGAHDADAAMKTFAYRTGEGKGKVDMIFPAIGAGLAANSFSLYGNMRWQAFEGDWYDATLIYRDFVHTYAKWLPEIDENGRPDTADKFKEIALWISDYIPNSPSQRDARPMQLAAVSDRYGKDYWFEAPIELKKRLGVPIGYHVYNWHEIPFNINYPHFTPAREEFYRGAAELKKNGVYIFPYINGFSWEANDADEGYEVNFKNTGYKGAGLLPDGKYYWHPYPQKKANGEKTLLVGMCPTFHRWHQLINDVAREMEKTMPIDGIYFDEISAHIPHSCRGKGHMHLPGGGSYWGEGYNRMMEKIRMEKPEDAFYFSESNGEVFAKSFDGFLTWLWTTADDVPAFSLVYGGYIQLIGRYTDGATRDNDDHFRYHIARALIAGQQPGWINAHVVYNEERMAFLEKIVKTRYKYTKLFNGGRLLRPPYTETDTEPVPSPKSGMMAQVFAGVWQMRDKSKTVLFLINVSKEKSSFRMSFNPDEYGIANLPEEFTVDKNGAYLEGVMEPCDIRVWEF